MEYQKVKSVAKTIQTKGDRLERLILDTMNTISSIVGATLGPGGQPILIERFEHGLPASITKDGISVFRSLGFDNPAAHCIMEAARDAAIRTASEAGDGTTTATVLAESIVRRTHAFCKSNPRVSPQKVVRRLEQAFKETIEPEIRKLSVKADLSTEEGHKLLYSVAKISANGEVSLANAVMECFDLVGDDGNVTITELSGESHYEVEKIEGYPIGMGYEESCAKFYTKFINDPGTQRCVMEKPVFVVYHGHINEIQTIVMIMEKVANAWQQHGYNHNVVIVATGFSESVLAQLAFNFAESGTINVFPLVSPQFPIANGQLQFLEDICAVTGARLFDPLNCPLNMAELEDLGPGIAMFEVSRFRSNIVGKANEDLILLRVDQLQTLMSNPESEWDRLFLQERIAKLTGGIAKLKVVGASNGELKEKRDRAEDAVCGVRGAIKHGCLPGGGWTLLKLISLLKLQADPIIENVLMPALFEPVARLLLNIGINAAEGQVIVDRIISSMNDKPLVYDAQEGKFIDAFEGGILDSTPAVLEAIRNSISIASLLGTLGGTVVFSRDTELEKSEASAVAQWQRDVQTNPADERG